MPGPVSAAVCISARDEERTIAAVLTQTYLTPGVDMVLVAVNGCRDRTAEVARRVSGRSGPVRVLVRESSAAFGHDVGRGITASWALDEGAGILLFVDADFVVPSRDLIPFVEAVRRGTDVALNGLGRRAEGWVSEGPVASARRALNGFLGRADLGQNGLVAVPHALSRRAVEVIGPDSLMVPPVAHARAVMAGLTVKVAHSVDIILPNRPAPDRPRALDRVTMTELILGDHLEAVSEILRRRGVRGGFPDHGRDRSHTGSEDRPQYS